MGSITNPPTYGQIPPSGPPKKKWNPNIYIPAIVIGLVLLWHFGRGSKKVYEAADVGVARFHGLMNQEGYEQIYREAAPELQNHGSREETVGFLQRVHTSLGNEHQCHMTGFFVNRTLKGTFVVLTYSTPFDHGTAKEQFTWRMSGDQASWWGTESIRRRLLSPESGENALRYRHEGFTAGMPSW